MKARILSPTSENIALAAAALRSGDIVGMPTETVYGLAGGVSLPLAVAKIFDVKERPTFDPLIVHVSSGTKTLESLSELRLVDLMGFKSSARKRARTLAQLLIDEFWPGPLTLVLPKHLDVPDIVTSGLSTVGIRMPRHPVAQRLIDMAGMPLAAPSANRFGRISPTRAQDVDAELGDRINYILDGGRSDVGLESTVLAISPEAKLSLLRPGIISKTEIEEITGISVERPPASKSRRQSPRAPGMLESHYAPHKPLTLLPCPVLKLRKGDFKVPLTSDRLGVLLLSGDPAQARQHLAAVLGVENDRILVKTLSRTGDFQEIARHLFAELRALDASDVDWIVAEPCSVEVGLGHAIADRLKRASAGRS
ncbi:MAG: threonylcarbamoyl-AMP synthase [Bdellovibrionales bacterium RIFOXYC1_FULL_54_43]|nr:MAG: threonylcarbamoyl-AMP synthase [Bdellovibrionales bacterium RIFOXYC1_FULL_54_43]